MSSSSRPWNCALGLAPLAQQGERALDGITQHGERNEGNVEQLGRAKREVSGYDADFVAVGRESVEQEVEIRRDRRSGRSSGVGNTAAGPKWSRSRWNSAVPPVFWRWTKK